MAAERKIIVVNKSNGAEQIVTEKDGKWFSNGKEWSDKLRKLYNFKEEVKAEPSKEAKAVGTQTPSAQG